MTGIDPIIFELGPFAIRWYGLLMATAVGLGFYYIRRDGVKLGFDEDTLYNTVFLMVLGGVIGARTVYVLTNWAAYADRPIDMIRIDQGGLSIHGAIIVGVVVAALYLRRKRYSAPVFLDLGVPGVAIGIFLVRIANLINGEVLGRVNDIWFYRHPAQLIGSAIGLILLIIHNHLAKRRPPAGYLFWSFVLYYSLFRGIIEETVRDNPLYAWGYISDTWGIGFFTLTHLITPFLVGLGWWMRKRAKELDRPLRASLLAEGDFRKWAR